MPQSYKGYEIPAYTDDADAVKAFQDYTDSVDEKLGLPDDTTTVGAQLALKADRVDGTSAPSSARGVRNITVSTSAPIGGSDGDVWIQI